MSLTRSEHRELLRALRLEETIPGELVERAERHIETCPKCRQVLQKTRRLKKRLTPMLNASHPGAEALLAYLTAEDSAHARTATAESVQNVSAHLRTCAFCRSRVQHLRNEIGQVENLMQDVEKELAFEHDYQIAQSPQAPKRKIFLPPMPKAIWPVATACVALLFLFFLSLSTQPKTYALAHLKSDRLNVLPVERGSSAAEINLRMTEGLINAGDYGKARQMLVDVPENELSDDQLLRLHLCDLMLTLKSAHRSFAYLFPHFDKAGVQTSLERMREALVRRPAPAAGNEAYWGLAHYYSAKAYLMLDDESAALAHLQNARLTAHQRRHETDDLLRALMAK
jgi:hypothetical protein